MSSNKQQVTIDMKNDAAWWTSQVTVDERQVLFSDQQCLVDNCDEDEFGNGR